MISKVHTKLVGSPFNIVEHMKKTNVSIPMWNVLALPSQRELLQHELQAIEMQSRQPSTSRAISLVQPRKEEGT